MQPVLKTRLIGAFVLIALAVIIVPLFFPGEPSGGSGQNISLAIPSTPDQQLQTRTLSVAPPSTSAATAPAASVPPSSGKLATVDIPSRVPPAVDPDATSAPAATPAAPPAAAATAFTHATAPATAAPVPADEAAATANPGRAANGNYVVTLGAYTQKANAEKLVANVGKLGYTARVSPVSVGGIPAARVDVGPFDTRAGAEVARLKLHAALPHAPAKLVSTTADQHGNAPATALPKARAGGWAVQVVAYDKRSDAEHLRDRLRKAGFASYVDDVKSGGNTLWRVRVGPLARRSDAVGMVGRIKDKFPHLKGVVVTVP